MVPRQVVKIIPKSFYFTKRSGWFKVIKNPLCRGLGKKFRTSQYLFINLSNPRTRCPRKAYLSHDGECKPVASTATTSPRDTQKFLTFYVGLYRGDFYNLELPPLPFSFTPPALLSPRKAQLPLPVGLYHSNEYYHSDNLLQYLQKQYHNNYPLP